MFENVAKAMDGETMFEKWENGKLCGTIFLMPAQASEIIRLVKSERNKNQGQKYTHFGLWIDDRFYLMIPDILNQLTRFVKMNQL